MGAGGGGYPAVASFGAFYRGVYLNEHTVLNTRRLHYLGTGLVSWWALGHRPLTMLSAAGAVGAGLALQRLDAPSLKHGLREFAGMVLAFVLLQRAWYGTWKDGLVPLAFGYGPAWVAHAAVERNR